jgi:hypothetical protein
MSDACNIDGTLTIYQQFQSYPHVLEYSVASGGWTTIPGPGYSAPAITFYVSEDVECGTDKTVKVRIPGGSSPAIEVASFPVVCHACIQPPIE